MAKIPKRQRCTGVLVKLQRMMSNVISLADYLLDRKKDAEKLLCPPFIFNIRLPMAQPGKKMTRKQHCRALAAELKRPLAGVQDGRYPIHEIMFSLSPGEAWSPGEWKRFWRRFIYHLSKVTYVTDHCGDRIQTGKKSRNRTRPAKLIQVDLGKHMAVCPIHDNTGSQHLQALLSLWNPIFRKLAVINDGRPRIAVQWAARRAEQDLSRTPHSNMPDYEFHQVGNRWFVIDPKDTIIKDNELVFLAGKTKESNTRKTHWHGRQSEARQMRTILEWHPPESFSFEQLHEHLLSRRACLLRSDVGMLFCVDGKAVETEKVGHEWASSALLERWPEMAEIGSVVGMMPDEQERLVAGEVATRWQAAGLTSGTPPKAELIALVKTAHSSIDVMPWNEMLIESRRESGTSMRRGNKNKAKLKELIEKMFLPESEMEPILDQTLHFRPVLPSGQLMIPLWELTKQKADWLCKNYTVSLVAETRPGRFCALILLDAVPGREPWENKRAQRRLTFFLAKRYKAQAEIVADDGIPFPGLPQLAGTGHVVKLIGAAKNITCPKASRLLAAFAEGLAAKEKVWRQGFPGWVLNHPEAKRLHYIQKVYKECVEAIAENPFRVNSIEEMNLLITTRWMGQRRSVKEVETIFNRVRRAWPELAPKDTGALWEEAREFAGRYGIDLLRPAYQFNKVDLQQPKTKLPLAPQQHISIPNSFKIKSPPVPFELQLADLIGRVSTSIKEFKQQYTEPRETGKPSIPVELQIYQVLEHVFTGIKAFVERVQTLRLPRLGSDSGLKLKQAQQIGSEMIAMVENERLAHRAARLAAANATVEYENLAQLPVVPAQSQTQSKSRQVAKKTDSLDERNSAAQLGQIQCPADHKEPMKPKPIESPNPMVAKQSAPSPQIAPPSTESKEMEKDELVRRRKEKRLHQLQALVETLDTTGDNSLENLILHRPEFERWGMEPIVKVLIELSKEAEDMRLEQFLSWINDPNTKAPSWLDGALSLHESAIGTEPEHSSKEWSSQGDDGLIR